MGQVFRRTKTIMQVSTKRQMAAQLDLDTWFPLIRAWLSASLETALWCCLRTSLHLSRFFFSVGNKCAAASADQLWSCCGGLSYTGLGPAILWFCLSHFFVFGGHATTSEWVLSSPRWKREHDMQNPLKQRLIIQFIIPGVVCMIETRH